MDGVTVKRLADAVRAGDIAQVRAMLTARPELVNMDMAENDEHRAAALRRAGPCAGDGARADGARRRRPEGDLSASRRHQRADAGERARLRRDRRHHSKRRSSAGARRSAARARYVRLRSTS